MNQSYFDKMYRNILAGKVHNIKFTDLCDFVVDLGFRLARQNGTSHKVFIIEGSERILVLQEDKSGCAKPYQVRQVRDAIKSLKIGGKDDK